MTKYLIVTDSSAVISSQEDHEIISPSKYIRNLITTNGDAHKARPKVINLCNNFDYLGKGYYISLLAEARGMGCVPHISNIVTLNWKRNYEFALPELNILLNKTFNGPGEEPLTRTYMTYFGRHENPKLEPVCRRLFDLFRFPVLSFEIKFTSSKKWSIEKIDSGSISSLTEKGLENFHDALGRFTGSAWRMTSSNKKTERYWIAILHDPNDKQPPSNKAALNKFIKIGKQMGIWVELITKQDFSSLLEYDALFIRETTAINNHTYRFAAKAELEDIPVVDDTQSIIRCCNKVFLYELLQAKKVPVPKTIFIDRHQKLEQIEGLEFPLVIKIPDGSFSHGVYKAKDMDQFKEISTQILKKSEIILCQEFVESDFDWRIGVLDGKAIFALKYYMAVGHWQIYNHAAKSKSKKEGAHEAVPLDEVPQNIIEVATKAANLVGKGFYGVDLKQRKDNGQAIIIEVNDNPSLETGVEDMLLGDELYRMILQHLVRRIEAKA